MSMNLEFFKTLTNGIYSALRKKIEDVRRDVDSVQGEMSNKFSQSYAPVRFGYYDTGGIINSATVQGIGTKATGTACHAEGQNTTARGTGSHAEGRNTTASMFYSHAEGEYTTASGSGSHAEGRNTTASGTYSHAEGYYSIAKGDYSHAEGYYTGATCKSQHVQGECNILDVDGTKDKRGKYAHIVGNGTSSNARSNAHTLAWDGTAWFAGDVYVGSTSGTNRDEGSKRLVTETDLADSRMHVTITGTGTGDERTYTADKTVDEILDAVKKGILPTCNWPDVSSVAYGPKKIICMFAMYKDLPGLEGYVEFVHESDLIHYSCTINRRGGIRLSSTPGVDKRLVAPSYPKVGQIVRVKAAEANQVTETETVDLLQPDWMQNDVAALDYVKNRPGGYDVVHENEIEIVTDGTGSGQYFIQGSDLYLFRISDDFIPTKEELLHCAAYDNDGTVLSDDALTEGDGWYGHKWMYVVTTEGAVPIPQLSRYTLPVGLYAMYAFGVYMARAVFHRAETERVKIPASYLDIDDLVVTRTSSIDIFNECLRSPGSVSMAVYGNESMSDNIGWAHPVLGWSYRRVRDTYAIAIDAKGDIWTSVMDGMDARPWGRYYPNSLTVRSSSRAKTFKITVDDSGVISTTEVT